MAWPPLAFAGAGAMRRVALFEGIRPLTRKGAVRDSLAGLTVASMNIPQVLGYTRIAGTPVITGLYALLLPLACFAVFGSSRHLVVSADSATAAILAGGLAGRAPIGSDSYMALVTIVTLLTAGLLFVAWVFRLGFLADFLSRTVLVGFLTGCGFQIGIAMLPDMLGLTVVARGSIEKFAVVLANLPHVNWPTVGLSVVVVVAILAAKRFAPRLPVALVAVVGGIAASFALNFGARGIALIGPVPGGLPSIRIPSLHWTDVVDLFPIAGSCFVMIIAQSAATSRIFALKHHERADEDANILGLSAANVAASLSGSIIVNGSLSQTAAADSAGARSQFSQLVISAIVTFVLLFATGPLQYLPHAILAGIVFTIAVGLVDVRSLRDILRTNPGEFAVTLATAASVVIIGVEQGILIAMAISLLQHVRHSYRPNTTVLAPDETGRWVPTPVRPGVVTEPGLIVYHFGADLFYANSERFADEVHSLINNAPSPVRYLVIDASAITDLDYTAARSFKYLCSELRDAGVEVVLARVTTYLKKDLDANGITSVVGEDRVFARLHEALEYVQGGDAATGIT